MNIAIVTINQENAAIASWLAAQDFSGCTTAHWQIEPQPVVAEQVLDALVEQWQRNACGRCSLSAGNVWR